MQLITALTAAAAAFGSASAAALDSRQVLGNLVGRFEVSKVAGCPIKSPVVINFAWGGDSPKCHPFHNGAVYTTVNRKEWDPRCLLTLFQRADCSDPGIVSGPGCWQPEGQMRAFKVTCPYK